MFHLVQFPDNPAVPCVPACSWEVLNVVAVVFARRNDEHTAVVGVVVVVIIAGEQAGEVDGTGTEHDGGVR